MARKVSKRFTTGYFSRAIAGYALIYAFLLLYMLLGYNFLIMADDFRKEFSIQVYIDNTIPQESINEIEASIWRITGISEVRYISSGDALESMKELFGEGIFSGLKANPLPAGFEVKLDRNYLGWENMENVVKSIRPIKGIEEIDYGGDLLNKVDIIREYIITVGLTFLLIITIAATAVASSASQILYFRDKEKIDIMRMLGATDFYMARPLIIQGLLIGLFSSIFALLLSFVIYILINNNLIEIEFIPPYIITAVIFWAGIWSAYGGYSGFLRGKKTGE